MKKNKLKSITQKALNNKQDKQGKQQTEQHPKKTKPKIRNFGTFLFFNKQIIYNKKHYPNIEFYYLN